MQIQDPYSYNVPEEERGLFFPRVGDTVRVRASGETGTLISTEQYNAMVRGRLDPARWAWTRWVKFHDAHRPGSPVVGHGPSELQVLSRVL